ncbi:MAG: HEPN domain-containing protein [Isosphaeraceae bacterium]
MAIVNTLQKCLDSPYLFVDEDAPKRVGSLLLKAGDRLEAAANILNTGQGDGADATFLSYEAMFNTLRALVYYHGYREAGLRCLLLACESLYVKKGLVDAQHIHDFERVQSLRLPPNESLIAASKFVKRALELLTAAPAK